jgi:hypothetical protein
MAAASLSIAPYLAVFLASGHEAYWNAIDRVLPVSWRRSSHQFARPFGLPSSYLRCAGQPYG